MKSFCRFSIMALAFLALTGSAFAVDLDTNALVTIVEGLSLVQDTAMNFGELVLNNGSVIIAAADGATTDADFLITDATNISQGLFTVTGLTDWNIQVDATAGVMPAGLTLGTFLFSWGGAAGAVAPANYTMLAGTAILGVGATLTVDRTSAVVGATTLPYNVEVLFQ